MLSELEQKKTLNLIIIIKYKNKIYQTRAYKNVNIMANPSLKHNETINGFSLLIKIQTVQEIWDAALLLFID